MKYIFSIICCLVVSSFIPKSSVAQFEVLQNIDSVKYYYAQFDAYTPQDTERQDYYKLKYTLSWLMQDEAKVVENLKALSAIPSTGAVNANLILDLQFMNGNQLPKIYDLLNTVIAKQTQQQQLLPLYISKVGLLEKMNNDALTMEELPKMYQHFKGNDSAIAFMDLLQIKVLGRNNRVAEAEKIASTYLNKKVLNQDIFDAYVRMLFNNKNYAAVIKQAAAIKQNKRLDLYPELAIAYNAQGQSAEAVKYMDVIYSNMHYRTFEEINLSLATHDTSATLFPEAYIEYDRMDGGLGFHFVPVDQFIAMAEIYTAMKSEEKACALYQFAILGINAFESADINVLSANNSIALNAAQPIEEQVAALRKENQVKKASVKRQIDALKQCNLLIK